MKITVVGTGYVGLVTGTCFSEMGNDVTCVDIDRVKLSALKQGVVPIHEPGLDELIVRNVKSSRLNFSDNLSAALVDSAIVFIAVGTPPNEDGSADLSHVLAVARQIGEVITQPVVVVDKSTVPVGTADLVSETIATALRVRGVEVWFEVVSNPEFLKEGAAVQDFMSPDRIVVGAESERARLAMHELYSPFSRAKDKILFMGVRDAEMTKYAANAMLATKISFMNEISLMCEAFGVDVEEVRKGIGSDSRIGHSFIYPGAGYGGSCFPKDVRALVSMARSMDIDPLVFQAVEERNDRQKHLMFEKLEQYFGEFSGKHIAVWGLSFKPDTDDVREAPALIVIGRLLQAGATVSAFDPEASETALASLNNPSGLRVGEDMYQVLENADALLLMTEWKVFRQPDFALAKKLLKKPVIFDGRNIYSSSVMLENGFEYFGVGRSAMLAN
jgi:UDPglucose 6-dehydrogenase